MLRSLSLGVFGMVIGVGMLMLVDQRAEPQQTGPIDVKPQPVARIPVGTVIGAQPPAGWSHLILIATPTLTEQALKAAPKHAETAIFYARMFKFTVLADVASTTVGNRPTYYLNKVARGFATTVKGQETIVSRQNTLGANLGFFGKMILDENERILDNDFRQVARTSNMMILDAQAVVLRDKSHLKMIMRHAIVVDPQNGRLQSFIWLLDKDYQAAEAVIQALPPSFHEQRWLSILPDKFGPLGVPSRDAFALRQTPQGKAISYNEDLRRVATIPTFTAENVPQTERVLLHVARWVANSK
ncbi:MAG: hypothetical protein FJ271_14170 [Planctomycetes bacterium]|nr:hypothetical protein [Planctomycetota bacterium]